jgi:hypothetical protein
MNRQYNSMREELLGQINKYQDEVEDQEQKISNLNFVF